jgi:hypothetical protein
MTMSEYNLPNHVPFCGCTKCKIHRLSHQSHPSSTLNAGLFAVGTAPVKLADLINGAGVKLGDCVPKSALTVTLRSVSIIDDVHVAAPDNADYPFTLPHKRVSNSPLPTFQRTASGPPARACPWPFLIRG